MAEQNWPGSHIAGMLRAYAATLRQQAGRVDEDEGFNPRRFVRHMADVLEAGGDLFKIDADLARLGAAIQAALAQNTQGDGELEDLRRRNINQAELIRELQHKLGMAVGYPNPAHAERARVPDGLIRKALAIASNMRTADWLDAGGTVREQDQLADYLAAAPSQRAEVK